MVKKWGDDDKSSSPGVQSTDDDDDWKEELDTVKRTLERKVKNAESGVSHVEYGLSGVQKENAKLIEDVKRVETKLVSSPRPIKHRDRNRT